MDVDDALELLSIEFKHPTVRKYAVARVQTAPSDDILMYLLQLVQALKHENFAEIRSGDDSAALQTSIMQSTVFPRKIICSRMLRNHFSILTTGRGIKII